MSSRILLRGLFVACLVPLASCSRTGPNQFVSPGAEKPAALGKESPLVGKPAPDVEGTLLDGSEFSLKQQYASNVVMLDFWATWCGPCIAELPILMKLADDYKAKGVVLYAVNQEEDAETVRKFIEENGWKLNVVLDPNGKHGTAYRVSGIPQLVFIDRGGIVRKVHTGYGDGVEQILRDELDEILAAPTSLKTDSARPTP